jgi:hypothetical protein
VQTFFLIKFRPSSHSEDLSDLKNYQHLKIKLALPLGVNKVNLPLVLDQDQAEIVKELFLLCGEPQIIVGRKKQTWTFDYAGDEIYFEPSADRPKGTIYFMGRHWSLKKGISVTVIQNC